MEPFDLNKAVKEVSDPFTLTKDSLNNLHDCKTQKERLEKLRKGCTEAARTSENFEDMKYFFSAMASFDQTLALTGIEQVLIELKHQMRDK